MSNPFEEAQQADVDLGQFADWLEETAEREDASADELLGQLVSTHWILSELTELVEESQFEASTASTTDDAGAAGDESPSELLEVVRAFTESQSSTQQATSSDQAIDQSVLELVRALNQGGAPASQPAAASGGAMSYRDVRAMVDDINTVEDDVDALRQEVSGTLGALESTVEELTDAVQDNTASIEELEAGGADRAQRLAAVEDRFDSSFGDIREILTHLVDATSEQDVKLETIVDTYEEEMGEVKRSTDAHQHLAELKQTAARRDISKAACAGCEQTFRVSLLGEPACPHCDREIEGFSTERGSLGRSNYVARVRDLPAGGDTGSLSSRVERAARTVSPAEDAPSMPDEPDWWEPANER